MEIHQRHVVCRPIYVPRYSQNKAWDQIIGRRNLLYRIREKLMANNSNQDEWLKTIGMSLPLMKFSRVEIWCPGSFASQGPELSRFPVSCQYHIATPGRRIFSLVPSVVPQMSAVSEGLNQIPDIDSPQRQTFYTDAQATDKGLIYVPSHHY